MAKLTIGLGVILTLLGVMWYVFVNNESWTALIPSFIGIPILLLGIAALRENLRKHAMHGAAAISLIGFLGTAPGVLKVARMLGGATIERGRAAVVQAVVAALLAAFLVACVRSFVNARRLRES
jgi:uncharacterized membrane protein